jgi:hypothetical protein
MATKSAFSKEWKQFVDHEWIKNKFGIEPSATQKIEAGAAVLLRPVLQAYASGRQGFHEVLAN